MATKKELTFFRTLKFVKSVSVYYNRWSMIMKIVDSINTNNAQIITKDWCDDFKRNNPQIYSLDLTNIKTWSTYEDCSDIKFYLENEKLICDVTIYDGRLLNGDRENMRFKAKLMLNMSFIIEIEPFLATRLDNVADDAYDDYLETVKENWTKNFKEKIYSGEINEK